MTHVHMSLLHSADPDAVSTHVRRTIARHQPRTISTTEADRFRAALTGIPGYATVHPTGTDGESECAWIVAQDQLAAALPAVQLSDKPIPRRGGEHVHAVPSELVNGDQILAVHMPSGVEGPAGFDDEHPAQVEAYRDAIGGLRRYIATHPVTEIHGDWNLDARLPWVRDYFAEHFPGFVIVAPRTPTHGDRVIDWALIRKGSGRHTATTEASPVSDHETVIVTKEARVSRLITRAEWGASPQRATTASHPIGRTHGITVHWEGPGIGSFPHDLCARKVRAIERFHEVNRGWADLAYNALVCPHGFVFEGRGPGVMSAANGDTDTNDDWYAVCYIGGQGDPFTAAAREGFLWAFGWLAREGDAGPKRNGHRDHKPTQCPGDVIYAWVHTLPDGAGATTDGEDWLTMATEEDLRRVVREELAAAFRNNGERRVIDLGEARIEDPDGEGPALTLGRYLKTITTLLKGKG